VSKNSLGIVERIKNAADITELQSLVSEMNGYYEMSPKTRRRAEKRAYIRNAQLKSKQ